MIISVKPTKWSWLLVLLIAPPLLAGGDLTQPPRSNSDAAANENIHRAFEQNEFRVPYDYDAPVKVVTTPTTTLSDGTNAFTVVSITVWRELANTGYHKVTICGSLTTGGTVTGAKLRFTGFDFAVDTTRQPLGYANGTVFSNGGTDPRNLISPSVVSSNSFEVSRSSASAWSSSTAYNFNWTGLVPWR